MHRRSKFSSCRLIILTERHDDIQMIYSSTMHFAWKQNLPNESWKWLYRLWTGYYKGMDISIVQITIHGLMIVPCCPSFLGTAHGFAVWSNRSIPDVKEAHEKAFPQTVEYFEKTLPVWCQRWRQPTIMVLFFLNDINISYVLLQSCATWHYSLSCACWSEP